MSLKKYLAAALVIPASFSINAAEYDFDGDGYADIAVRRASTGVQYILNSTGSNVGSHNGDGIQRHSLGDQETDIPISGDFDGDGIWDIGVRRPSTFEWFIRYSSTGEINTFIFGKDENDIPVPADYDGDGITDLAVRRPSTQYWYIKNSSGVDERTGNTDGITREIFGRQSTDIPVPADYDGDGKADIAVRRASNFTWYIKNSSGTNFNSDNGDGIQRIVFGKNENDIAVPADYNGDGYADVAVRRPSNYMWYIKNSNDDNYNSSKGDGIQRIVFGRNEDDIPVVTDYDGDGIADIAVRRTSNQMFYIRNSSGNNFNSSNEDGIQRHNFGKKATDIAIVQPSYKLHFVTSAVDVIEVAGIKINVDNAISGESRIKITNINAEFSSGDVLSYLVSKQKIPAGESLSFNVYVSNEDFTVRTLLENTAAVPSPKDPEHIFIPTIQWGFENDIFIPSKGESVYIVTELNQITDIWGFVAGPEDERGTVYVVDNDVETVSIAGIVFSISNSNDETIISYRNESFDLIEGEVFVSHIITESSESLNLKAFEVYLQNSDETAFTYVGRKGASVVPDVENMYAVNVSSHTQGIMPEIPIDQGEVNIRILETNITNIKGIVVATVGEGQQIYWAN